MLCHLVKVPLKELKFGWTHLVSITVRRRKTCLVSKCLKCLEIGKRDCERSRSIAQWTMGTFSVDAKDAGRLAGSQIAPVTLESATTRLGTRQTQHSKRASEVPYAVNFLNIFSFFHFPYFHSPSCPILFPRFYSRIPSRPSLAEVWANRISERPKISILLPFFPPSLQMIIRNKGLSGAGRGGERALIKQVTGLTVVSRVVLVY